MALLQGSLLLGQTIEYNQSILLQHQSTVFRNINIAGDSLIITGEIGADSTGLQRVFMLTSDTVGNLGVIRFFKDPQKIDHMLLNGSQPVIYGNHELIFSGEFLWKSDNYWIKYNKSTGELNFSEYAAPFIVRFTESLLDFSDAFYVVGYIQTQDFDLDLFLQKIDSTGNKIWEKTYGIPSKDETGRAAIIEDDGLTIMVSESFDNTPNIKNDTRYWIRFMHVDTSGAIVRDWREEVTGQEGWSGSLVKFNDDYIYTSNLLGEEFGFGYFQAGQVVRRDQDFNLVWRRPYGDPDNYFNGLGDLIISADSNLLLTGQLLDESQKYVLQRVMKICPDGEVIWELRDTGLILNNGESLNFMEGIAASSCNSVYSVGYTYKSAGFYEGLILKVTGDGCIDTLCTTTDIEHLIRLNEQKIDVYPNPMQDELNIVLDESLSRDAKVLIYNAMGHLVFSGRMDGSKKVMDVSEWPGGMYVIRVEADGVMVGSVKVVKAFY